MVILLETYQDTNKLWMGWSDADELANGLSVSGQIGPFSQGVTVGTDNTVLANKTIWWRANVANDTRIGAFSSRVPKKSKCDLTLRQLQPLNIAHSLFCFFHLSL